MRTELFPGRQTKMAVFEKRWIKTPHCPKLVELKASFCNALIHTGWTTIKKHNICFPGNGIFQLNPFLFYFVVSADKFTLSLPLIRLSSLLLYLFGCWLWSVGMETPLLDEESFFFFDRGGIVGGLKENLTLRFFSNSFF